jgi:hypothetical protein
MNKKLITSTALNWPDIDDETSLKIISCLENELVKYPILKRAKNPPKKLREKLKSERVEKTDEEKLIKSHFLFGINSITRYIENIDANSKQILCVLVCRSCRPLRILTQHLIVMCSQKQISAGCVNNLSNKISNLFNLNRASAIAILESDFEIVRELVNQVKSSILPLLSPIENPILKYDHEIELEEEFIDKRIDDVDQDNQIKSFNEIFVFDKKEKKNDDDFLSFGAQFVEINSVKKRNITFFNDKSFISFNNSINIDNYDEEKQELSSKRSHVEFKQFGMTIRLANKEKSKEKNKLKNKLAEIKNKKKQKSYQNKKIKK